MSIEKSYTVLFEKDPAGGYLAKIKLSEDDVALFTGEHIRKRNQALQDRIEDMYRKPLQSLSNSQIIKAIQQIDFEDENLKLLEQA